METLRFSLNLLTIFTVENIDLIVCYQKILVKQVHWNIHKNCKQTVFNHITKN